MDHKPIKMDERPLDLEVHEGDARWAVWKRRLIFIVLIVAVIAIAAPTFGSCSGALKGDRLSETAGTFRIGDEVVRVTESELATWNHRFSIVGSYFPQGVAHVIDPRRERLGAEHTWQILMLDAAARREGVHISDAQIRLALEEIPHFRGADGKFDPAVYRAELRAGAGRDAVDHDGFSRGLRALLRSQVYLEPYAAAFLLPSSREAYETWKTSNLKVSVDYVVQPFEALREEALRLPVTDEDLLRAAPLPGAVALRAIPARRGLEGAYIRVGELKPEHQKAMEEFVTSAGIHPDPDAYEAAVWTWFYDNHKPTGAFTRETWVALQRPAYEAKLKEWEATPEPRGEKPKDPAEEPWPEKAPDQFYGRWQERVTREVLARDVLRHMAGRAARESKSLRDLLPEYEKFGVKVVETEQPLTDAELAEKFPAGLGKSSELDQVVRNQFRPPENAAQFAPKVTEEPIPATKFVRATDDRGWLVLRWTSFEPERERKIDEIRTELTEFFRNWRVHELAPARLAELRAKVEAAGGDLAAKRENLAKFAKEMGLEARTLKRFNARTSKLQVPAVSANPTPEEKAAADRIRHRNRIQDDYAVLVKQEVGKFREPPLVDDATGAAYLVLPVEQHTPSPAEMDAGSLDQSRQMQTYEGYSAVQERTSYEALRKKFALELTDHGKKATDADKSAPE